MSRSSWEVRRAFVAIGFRNNTGCTWAGAFRAAELALRELERSRMRELDRTLFQDSVRADLAALPTTEAHT